MPVLMIATYNDDGSVNVMNAAWGMMQERGRVALKLTETHKTVKNIKARGAFTVIILVSHPEIRWKANSKKTDLPQQNQNL